MLYISSLPGFALAIGMQFAVESPRWLYKVRPVDHLRLEISNFAFSCVLDTYFFAGREN